MKFRVTAWTCISWIRIVIGYMHVNDFNETTEEEVSRALMVLAISRISVSRLAR